MVGVYSDNVIIENFGGHCKTLGCNNRIGHANESGICHACQCKEKVKKMNEARRNKHANTS